MGWLDRFKSKNLPECLICSKKIKGDNHTQVKYRYGVEGKIGTAHLCEKCSRYVDQKEDEDYDQPI